MKELNEDSVNENSAYSVLQQWDDDSGNPCGQLLKIIESAQGQERKRRKNAPCEPVTRNIESILGNTVSVTRQLARTIARTATERCSRERKDGRTTLSTNEFRREIAFFLRVYQYATQSYSFNDRTLKLVDTTNFGSFEVWRGEIIGFVQGVLCRIYQKHAPGTWDDNSTIKEEISSTFTVREGDIFKREQERASSDTDDED